MAARLKKKKVAKKRPPTLTEQVKALRRELAKLRKERFEFTMDFSHRLGVIERLYDRFPPEMSVTLRFQTIESRIAGIETRIEKYNENLAAAEGLADGFALHAEERRGFWARVFRRDPF